MARRSEQKQKGGSKEKKQVPVTNEPWLSQRTGRIIMIVLSLVLVAFFTYQLEPALGFWEALLWGLGFGLAIWGVFLLAYSFNKWVRRR
jgi:hypothetical protein